MSFEWFSFFSFSFLGGNLELLVLLFCCIALFFFGIDFCFLVVKALVFVVVNQIGSDLTPSIHGLFRNLVDPHKKQY